MTTLTTSLGGDATGISFDGSRIWTANTGGSVSIITLNPFSVSTITLGFTHPGGLLYDGANTWVTDPGADKLFKLDSGGAIIQTVSMGSQPAFPAFDGTNIWVPNQNANTVTVVRAATGTVLATLTGNGMNFPEVASFDGERMLITNGTANAVSMWKASDLSPLGFVGTGMDSNPLGACSDGLNFWIALSGTGRLARF